MAQAQRVLDRRPIWTARQWDGSQEFLDWIRPGLDQGLLTYDDQEGVLRQWGAAVPEGGWLIQRDGWYDVQASDQAYQAKYEPAPASGDEPSGEPSGDQPGSEPGGEPGSDEPETPA